MDNFDLNKLLSIISKMDKKELEENINKAKQILENNDNLNKKWGIFYEWRLFWLNK